MPDHIIEANGVTRRYRRRGLGRLGGSGSIVAVNDVSFSLRPGSITGLIGESGSGKSTLGRLLGMMEHPDQGRVMFEGRNLAALSREERAIVRRKVQIVFQDPYESLDPRYTTRQTVEEPLLALPLAAEEREARVIRALEDAELRPAREYMHRRPYELSGGQRQRIAIARGIVLQPSLLIADEPTSMLDVSVRAGIVNVLRKMCDLAGMTMLLITHDLGTACSISERLLIMYRGSIVEDGKPSSIISSAEHAYTRRLIDAAPRITKNFTRHGPFGRDNWQEIVGISGETLG